jgi:AcrR family transcriptional regulator
MIIDDKTRVEAIWHAAAEIIIRHGYNKLTMRDIAHEIGLSRSLIYLQFKGKAEIIEP